MEIYVRDSKVKIYAIDDNGNESEINSPFKINYDNRQEFYDCDGNLHNELGPAISYHDGVKKWYVRGALHRTDGPAILTPKYQKYYLNGKCHREDGPAYIAISSNGDQSLKYYKHGLLHREDGPAVNLQNKCLYYFYEGQAYPDIKNDQEWVNFLKFKNFG